MKTAFVISPNTAISGYSNGVRSQAVAWKEGLETKGVQMDLVDSWSDYAWESYDVVHLFHYGLWTDSFCQKLLPRNSNVVFSPVIDSIRSRTLYGLLSRLPVDRLQFYSHPRVLKSTCQNSKLILVRSEFELEFIKALGGELPTSLVPIGYNAIEVAPEPVETIDENFCLHVSSWSQPRKERQTIDSGFRRHRRATGHCGKSW